MDNERDIDLESQGHDDAEDAALEVEKLSRSTRSGSAFLSWKDLTLRVSKDRKILQGLCGFAEPGHLLAIMGPSGSGKSTLLDTLAGRQSKDATITGQILLNGHKAKLSYGSAAYLAQDTALLGTLTVYETLYYSAKLRFADSTSSSDFKKRVDDAINEVGLQDAVNTPIGDWYRRGISGGEKRRVSIAIELLTAPQLLFLDEPTSGLDSASSFHVISTLKELAADGRTILCSIHQPSSEVFELFHDLCLLSDGRQVYYGPLPRALQFFERNGLPCPRFRSPADHYLHCVNSDFDKVARILIRQTSSISRTTSGSSVQIPGIKGKTGGQKSAQQRVDMLTQSYKESEEKKTVDGRIEILSQIMEGNGFDSKGSHASFFRQSVYLTMRSFVNMHRDIGYYWLRILMYIILSVCLGTIFNDIGRSYISIQARASCFTFLVSFFSFMAIGGFPSFIEDMKVFHSERLNGHYRVGAFVVGNSLSSLPFLFVISAVSVAIMYPLVKFHGGIVHIGFFLASLFACLVVSEALMMAVASLVSNFLLGIMFGAGTQGIYILVSGFFRLPDDLPNPGWKYPIFYMSYCAYGFQGLMENEFHGKTFEGMNPGDPPVHGHYILHHLYQVAMSRSKWWNLAILYSMALGYRLLFYVLLSCREEIFPTIGSLISKRVVAFRSRTVTIATSTSSMFSKISPDRYTNQQNDLEVATGIRKEPTSNLVSNSGRESDQDR